jgi:integral membrane protein (TIGR01906 family)
MKILFVLARFIFIICVPVLAFTATISWAVNNNQFYTHRFEKYDVQQSLAEEGPTLTNSQLKDIAAGFIHYFNSGEELINLTVLQNGKPVELFNREEILHFKDVKGLFRLNYYVLAATFIYCLAFALVGVFWRQGKHRSRLARSAVAGSTLTLGLMLLLGLGALLDFDQFFYGFHLIAFSNDYWSAAGNMLLLFPEGFWYDTVIYCGVTIALIALILGGLSCAYLVYRRKKDRGITPNSGAAGGS